MEKKYERVKTKKPGCKILCSYNIFLHYLKILPSHHTFIFLYLITLCSYVFKNQKNDSPVDDVVKTTSLGHGRILAVIVALADGLWVEVLRVTGVEVGLQTEVLRGPKPRVPQPGLLFLSTLIHNNELVLLPVPSFGVLRALRGLHSGGLGESGVLATAGLGWRVGLAVGFEGALRAAHEALASSGGDSQWIVLMDQVFLCLRSELFAGVFLVLQV